MDSVTQFYDSLADNYHLIASGWDGEVRRQGQLLHALLSKRFGIQPGARILDCSCGIGTQAIGLALQGYLVTGSDVSPKEIERAVIEAKRLGADVVFKVADFLTPASEDARKFDAVISFDNAIAHLNDCENLQQAFSSMKQKLATGGVLLVSARDYDQLRETKPTGTVPRMIEDEFGKRIYFQTWEWNKDGTGYFVNLFVLRPSESIWEGKPFQIKMTAFTADEVMNAMKNSEFKGVCRLGPDDSRYYQPVYAASIDEIRGKLCQ
ncbi:MAG: class I SAM-dependent methyltransferase [Proteobacteria bacterium]|nr:class I SAM-dependent methyltransferase [Pseudomonadota bacterium]